LRALHAHGVEFIVVGGVCAVLHGAPIATFDLDVVHARTPENVDRLLAALKTLGATSRAHPGRTVVPGRSHLESAGHQLLHTAHGLGFPRFGGHYLKGGYDVQNANQDSG
jgi:hypothetical protein